MKIENACTHDKDHDQEAIGTPKNILFPASPVTKIGVLELSTRACKLLVANIKDLIDGFNWKAFKNESELTNTGHLLDSTGHLSWTLFKRNVLPSIKRLVKKARSENVQTLYCVATAALRSAQNRQEIVAKIKRHTGINVQVLDQDQESNATICAFKWGADREKLKRTILLDQGGGSTELSAFSQSLDILSFNQSTNIPIGTTSSIHILCREHSDSDDLKTCLLRTSLITERLINRATYPLQNTDPFQSLIGLGSALTDATQKKSNQHQHNTRLDRMTLLIRQDKALSALTQRFKTLGELKNHFESHAHHFDEVQRLLVSFLGLGMVINVLDRLNLFEVTVYGIGLRYGICHQYIYKLYPDLTQRPAHYQQYLSNQLDGLSEGTWILGTISNIDPRFGIFVKLNDKHTGLIHLKVLRKHRASLSNFRRKEQLRVYLKKIQRSPKPKFFLQLSD